MKRRHKYSELDDSEASISWSDFSLNDPLSSDSEDSVSIKKYDISLDACDPNLYTDKINYYKEAYEKELERNKALEEEISLLKGEKYDISEKYDKIHKTLEKILSNTNFLGMGLNKIKEKGNLQEQLDTQRKWCRYINHHFKKCMDEIETVLLCPIKYDRITDPVTTPSGVTYDKVWLEHYLRNNRSDPITKESLTVQKLRPNIAVRNIIQIVKKYNAISKMPDIKIEI